VRLAAVTAALKLEARSAAAMLNGNAARGDALARLMAAILNNAPPATALANTNPTPEATMQTDLHDKLANCHPSLQRGQVWCRTCRATKRIDSAQALRFGWPKCCSYTMTIDHPDTWGGDND